MNMMTSDITSRPN